MSRRSKNIDRDFSILMDYLDGKKCAQISKKYGIQPERTRQIYAKYLRLYFNLQK